MSEKKSGKLQLALIAAVFLGPVLIGVVLFARGGLVGLLARIGGRRS